MKTNVSLPSYSGPLDLLLDLIEKQDINIYDIPIAEIADQYAQAVHSMEDVGLNELSEYMLYLATLLDIKAKVLVPEYNQIGEDKTAQMSSVDPREELISQLLQYKVFKDLSTQLYHKYTTAGISWYREPNQTLFEQDRELDLRGITVHDLAIIYSNLIQDAVDRGDLVKKQFRYVRPENVTVEDMSAYLLETVTEQPVSWKKLMSGKSKEMKIASFLSVLELSKEEKVLIGEEDGCMWVRKKMDYKHN